jgi:hypothetical protein
MFVVWINSHKNPVRELRHMSVYTWGHHGTRRQQTFPGSCIQLAETPALSPYSSSSVPFARCLSVTTEVPLTTQMTGWRRKGGEGTHMIYVEASAHTGTCKPRPGYAYSTPLPPAPVSITLFQLHWPGPPPRMLSSQVFDWLLPSLLQAWQKGSF